MSEVVYENEKLKVYMASEGSAVKFSFEGCIDEDFHCENLVSKNPAELHIDFNDVKVINSCGIREWVNFIEKLGPAVPIKYNNCPQIIVQQINMVDGFLSANASVETFFAPYFCEECDSEHVILLKGSDVATGAAPTQKCPDCNASEDMEFDAIEKQYFHFLEIKKSA